MQSIREQLQQFVARVGKTKVTFEVRSGGHRVTINRSTLCFARQNPQPLHDVLEREGIPFRDILDVITMIDSEPNIAALLRQYDLNGSPKRRATDEIALAATV